MNDKIKIAKELIRIAKIIIAESYADIVKRAIEHYAPEIVKYAEQNNIITSNYVFHHLKGGNTKHYVGTNAPDLTTKEIAQDVRFALMLNSNNEFEKSMIKNYIYKNQNSKRPPRKNVTIEYLQNLNDDVNLELNECIILPKKFHDWLHHQEDKGGGFYKIKSTGEIIDASSRDSCYQLLNRYRTDEVRLHEIIKEDFDNTNLISAIKSLNALISLSFGDQNATDAIDYIRNAYDTIKKQMISKNIAKAN